jgi:hypothetical protein
VTAVGIIKSVEKRLEDGRVASIDEEQKKMIANAARTERKLHAGIERQIKQQKELALAEARAFQLANSVSQQRKESLQRIAQEQQTPAAAASTASASYSSEAPAPPGGVAEDGTVLHVPPATSAGTINPA